MPKLEISKVHDAYAGGGECPLCVLMEGAERTYLASFQHSRVMEPNVRIQTNRTGFCPDHLGKLLQGENRLGLALVMLTHLQEKLPSLQNALEGTVAAAEGGRRDAGQRMDAAIRSLRAMRDDCFICGLLFQDLERYTWTILYLWRRDRDFAEVFRASRGFCLSHFCTVLESARGALRQDRLAAWLRDVVPLMGGSLGKLEKDLAAFIQLYQAGNRSLGTEEERSALARTLQKLSGRIHRPG